MKRSERIQTSVTEAEKRNFRVEAATRDQEMADLLRDLVYLFLDVEGHETSSDADDLLAELLNDYLSSQGYDVDADPEDLLHDLTE
ncbi:hypothetical protein [Halocalculus aciditolerans]|uniref:Uncharacterized protein n=1 Tax=Halocalculus aciditolerans TaxID=1383812 RepID=A0A830F4Z3_9EURY|nr:hypothetical protein [Halocalculus aciditolerans]GGL55315.1 hypothetical protein GCM10009039_11820 [Halocalculus aciditolerans]